MGMAAPHLPEASQAVSGRVLAHEIYVWACHHFQPGPPELGISLATSSCPGHSDLLNHCAHLARDSYTHTLNPQLC